MRVAALTMSFNEPVWARVWARHYAGQLGAAHCVLLDHGSDDGSADGLPVQVRRLGRSPLDEEWRAAVVSEAAAGLLRTYDAVIHTDVDELLIADPAYHAGLIGFARATADVAVMTAVGLDVHHIPDEEPAIDPARRIGTQRQWVRASSAMCKPVLVRRPVTWAPGFHACDAPMVLDRLYLLHLRYADLGLGLRRLARSRAIAVVEPRANDHQRVDDAAFEAMVRGVATMRRQDAVLDPWAPPLSGFLAAVRASAVGRGAERYPHDLGLWGDALWRLGPGMRGAF
ncbi:MAG: glycosyltransferase family 2 protein [Gemmatimonadaceae bacterium]|nr:glycosyltransferase family 2 protein [Acetobacteraceae bacterium]